MIGVINVGTGNAKSIIEAYKKLNLDASLCEKPNHLQKIKKFSLRLLLKHENFYFNSIIPRPFTGNHYS